MSSHQYPEDEFDEAAKNFPVGVHRQKPSQWKSVLPFLLVLIIVPLLAWGAAYVFTHRDSDGPSVETSPTPEATTTTEATDEPSEEVTETPSEEPSEEPSEQPSEEPSEEAPQLNKGAVIRVLNGTNVNGLAGQVTQTLTTNEYTSVEAANATGWSTEQTTIYFKPGFENDAAELGRILGIDLWKENSSDLGNSDIVIVLKGDFQQ
ncbi:MAG: LytR C-terminal domain-containing protein [Actinomycetaceae bacterium]|nr:LytR C-terminal domain-containing protein [Actinomycetaceae bacterium]